MPFTKRQDGWRRATPALDRADRLARAGEAKAAPKSRCLVAVKRVAAPLGLKAADLLLLDTLCAFTQPQDWEAGRRPVVWPSNGYLMERTGFSLSTLKRHARRLAEAGVIAFRDSPNGKRWGRRDADGMIVEAYGFDLSPLSARVEEFEALEAELAAERSLCQHLKRQITILRRSIRARLEAADGEGLGAAQLSCLRAGFDVLLDALPRTGAGSGVLQALLDRFEVLMRRVKDAFDAQTDVEPSTVSTESPPDLTPMQAKSDPHIQTTNKLQSSDCSDMDDGQDVQSQTPLQPSDQQRNQGIIEKSPPQALNLDMRTLLHVCPEFTSWARELGGYLRNWADLHRAAARLGRMIGIPEQGWQGAQDLLGHQQATAALALVFEKHASGEVRSPKGYFLGMLRKAGAGELHLERSFFGRLSAQAV